MSYLDYYLRTIKGHNRGIKLVVGGTGLGKTSNIPKLVNQNIKEGQKYVYISNRKQLIKEMQDDLDEAKIGHRLLPRDLDAVMKALREYGDELEIIINNTEFEALLSKNNTDIIVLKRIFQELCEVDNYETLPERMQRQIEVDARSIVMRAFRTILTEASTKSQNVLIDNPAIQALFPFIAFQRDSESHILLLTLHKAFHGFLGYKYDEDNNEYTFKRFNMTDFADYVIFLDEFDFLENNLIGLISSTHQIDDIFRFVQLFYNEMVNDKLPLPSYPQDEAIRNRIEGITKSIAKLQSRGIKYPQINQFTRSKTDEATQDDKKDKKREDAAIFRTSHMISSNPLYFEHSERSFHILREPQLSLDKYPLESLVGRVGGLSERIITLLKEIESTNEIIYKEILRQCFKKTFFEREIQQLTHFPRKRVIKPNHTERDALLENGYSLYDIQDLVQHTDREEVDVFHYTIYTTPEYMLKRLVQKNLVFGLSATADIPRVLHHFDLEWLQIQEDVNWIEIDDIDRQLIEKVSTEKVKGRGNTDVYVVKQSDLDDLDLKEFIEIVARDPGFSNTRDSEEGHQKQRVERFFSSVLWAYTDDKVAGTSHLLFLNSFRQIKFIFDEHGKNDFFEVRLRTHKNTFDAYDLSFAGQESIVVFYNASQAEKVHESAESRRAFDSLFHEGKHVFVVTQYLSAGNGVNLQYQKFADSGVKSDFLNLHLLEAPYFYFGNPETMTSFPERIATIKENLWYQAKLNVAKFTSDAYFKHILGEVHQSHAWNRSYHQNNSTKSDSLLNRIAAFIQAIGRIEREWNVDTPQQTIVMSREVYDYFRTYLLEDYEYIRASRKQIISHNLKQVFEQIESEIPQFYRDRQRHKDMGLAVTNNNCRQKITDLAQKLYLVRNSNDLSLRKKWEQLRRDALKHDFQSELLRMYDAVYQSPLVKNATLHLTDNNELISEDQYSATEDHKILLNSILN